MVLAPTGISGATYVNGLFGSGTSLFVSASARSSYSGETPYADVGTRPFPTGNPFCLRTVYAGGSYTLLVGPFNGTVCVAGQFVPIATRTAATLKNPDQIGVYIDLDASGTIPPVPGNIIMSGWKHTTSTDPQAGESFVIVAPPAATLNGTTFYWANQGAATVSGGGSSPIVLASPGNRTRTSRRCSHP